MQHIPTLRLTLRTGRATLNTETWTTPKWEKSPQRFQRYPVPVFGPWVTVRGPYPLFPFPQQPSAFEFVGVCAFHSPKHQPLAFECVEVCAFRSSIFSFCILSKLQMERVVRRMYECTTHTTLHSECTKNNRIPPICTAYSK